MRVTAFAVTLPLIAISGVEAVAALQRAGFRRRPTADGLVLERGYRVVTVSTHRLLTPEELREILRAAAIDYLSLLENLDPTEGYAPT